MAVYLKIVNLPKSIPTKFPAIYSGTPLKGHPSREDIYVIKDTPNFPNIMLKFSTPEERTPHCKGQKMPSQWCPLNRARVPLYYDMMKTLMDTQPIV